MTEERIRCPSCGALATPGVEWCGQCFARLVPEQAPPSPPPPPPSEPLGSNVPAPPMPTPADPTATPDGRTPGASDRRDQAGEAPAASTPSGRGTPASLLAELWELPTVPEPEAQGAPPGSPGERPAPSDASAPVGSSTADAGSAGAQPARPRPTWPCAVCGAANDIELDSCASCGAPFARLFQQEAAVPDVEPKRAVAFSLAFPGLGHAVAGRRAEGLARAILFTWAATTAILLLTAHPAGGLGILAPMALLFVLSAAAWYAVTALDAFRLASGLRQLVTSKVMLYSVAALMLVSVVSVLLMVTGTDRVR